MNYIKHLSGFYDKISEDNRLSSTHVSLYMALFQFWNINRFKNPVSITRGEVMRLSKIGSYHTYHKCMRQLCDFGYIKYLPSHNPLKGSEIYMYNYDTSNEQAMHNTSGNIGTSNEQAVQPSINNNKHVNNKTIKTEHTNNENKIPPEKKLVIRFFESEKSNMLEAQKFYNYFEANGWKVGGRTKMKNWKAAARNWMLNAVNYKKTNTQNLKNDKNYGEPL